ncbi:MAG: alpha/beta fold hydrolase [Bacillota bacterium]
MSPAGERYAEIQVGQSKLRMHYVAVGDAGAPLLLIHGFGGCLENWRPLLPALGRRFRVYAIDLPGFGRSDAMAAHYRFEDLVQTVGAFIRTFDLASLTVVGHSFGGLVAVELARLNQSRVDRLVLVDSAGAQVATPLDRPVMRLALRYPILGRWIIRALTTGRAFPRVVQRMGADAGRLNEEQLAALRVGVRQMHLPPTGRDSWVVDRFLDRVAQVPCFTLVLWGAEDRVIPVEQGVAIFKHLQHGQMQVVESCGHVMPMECPEEMLGALFQFLQE